MRRQKNGKSRLNFFHRMVTMPICPDPDCEHNGKDLPESSFGHTPGGHLKTICKDCQSRRIKAGCQRRREYTEKNGEPYFYKERFVPAKRGFSRTKYVKNEFDFDTFEATESPCKRCKEHRNSFPGCMENCARLDAYQTHLTHVVSTANANPGECGFSYLNTTNEWTSRY